MRKQTGLLITLIAMAAMLSSHVSARDIPYKSLEEFCLATNADTPENCACGQNTANELLTDEEQKLVLGLMLRDAETMAKIAQLAMKDDLMAKLARITEGCA